jgi:hypothetical protein
VVVHGAAQLIATELTALGVGMVECAHHQAACTAKSNANGHYPCEPVAIRHRQS